MSSQETIEYPSSHSLVTAIEISFASSSCAKVMEENNNKEISNNI